MKSFVKAVLLGVGFLLAGPCIIAAKIEEWILGETCERVFGGCKEILAGIPTIFGEYSRRAFYGTICNDVSFRATFLYRSMVAHRRVSIGPGCVIGDGSIVGHADIGENVIIAARASILSGKYQHASPDREGEISSAGPITFSRVSIGSNCWIGENAIVMDDLGDNCIVGAGAVVSRSTEPGGTYFGNPARRVDIKRKET